MDRSYQQLFDRFAYGYYIVELLSFGFAGYLRRQALAKMPLSEGSTVIDLMCGTGNNAKYLFASQYKNLTYIGIDISKRMIDRALYKYQSSNGSIDFVNANVFSPIPYKKRSEHLLCSYGLKCIDSPSYKAFVETIDVMLEKEGTVSILEFQLPSLSFMKILFKLYLHTVYRLGCLLATGSVLPAQALLRCISERIDLTLLKKLFQERGFEIQVEEKWMRSVVFIYGRRRT